MAWYGIVCILMLYPLALVKAGKGTGKQTQLLALAWACGILWFFMAFRRGSVGVDTKYYSYVFTQFQDIPWSRVFTATTYADAGNSWSFDFEPGYRLLNKVFACLFPASQTITIVNSTILLMLLFWIVRQQSPCFLLSIWLYLTLGIYQTQMNVTRNAIAIFLVYAGFPWIRQGKPWRYIGLCLLASTIHFAALALIPVYWLARRGGHGWAAPLAWIGGFCLLGLSFPIVGPVLRPLLPDFMQKYFLRPPDQLSSILVGGVHAGLASIVLLCLPRQQRQLAQAQYPEGFVMLTLNLCLFGLYLGLDDAARMAALFGPYLIVFLPQLLHLIPDATRRSRVTAAIAALSGGIYLLRLLVNNIGGTLPYGFCWQ